jgi:enoyl-CoA hydratase
MAYETILIEQRGRVLLVILNRQKALNAINLQLTAELIEAVSKADADPGIGCIVITGSEKAFAAGADIKEMQDQSYGEM